MKELEYRTSDYFNENDEYMFYEPSLSKPFKSKVHFQNGYWWTNESLKYKCTSIKCYKLH